MSNSALKIGACVEGGRRECVCACVCVCVCICVRERERERERERVQHTMPVKSTAGTITQEDDPTTEKLWKRKTRRLNLLPSYVEQSSSLSLPRFFL